MAELLLDELILAAAGLDADQRESFLRSSGAAPEVVDEARRRLAEADQMPTAFLEGDLGEDETRLAGARLVAGLAAEEPPPERIGPYRVDSELASGGMGEVYRGFDERLDRPVALKRVLPESAGSAKMRSRFRREARAAARLSHSAIVQVHDWVESDEADWLVMELVDGRPLDELMNGEPLPLEQVVRIARDVAAGLAAAHGAGIVHRDLKAANIMVCGGEGEQAERAKILDFGIAKPVALDPGATAALTETGMVIGTVAAMSPEQARGEEVDSRSDLFSLGILLYELTTGISPFRGAGPVETLTRICTVEPPEVRSIHPQVPPALAELIHHLLRKAPGERPQSALDVVAALETQVATGAGVGWRSAQLPAAGGWRQRARRWAQGAALLTAAGAALWSGRELFRGEPPPPLYVAVPATEIVGSGAETDPTLVLAAGAVHGGVLSFLAGLEGVVAVEPGRFQTDDPRTLATALGSSEILTSSLTCVQENCRVAVKRLRGNDASVRWAHGFSVAPASFLQTSRSVVANLRAGYPDRKARDGAERLEVRPQDYEAFLEWRQSYQTRAEGMSTSDRLRQLEQIQDSSPRFLDTYLFEATLARSQFYASRQPEDLERAKEAIRQAQILAPNAPWVLLVKAQLAMDGGDLAVAEQALDAAELLEPGDANLLSRRSRLLERQGEVEQGLQLMREAVRRQPSWANLIRLADMELRGGRVAAARTALETSLERLPGNFQTLSRLAQLELLNGSTERAAELYQGLVDRDGDETDLTNLGVCFLLLERYDEAARTFLRVLEENPTSPYALLNLADAEHLAGNEAAAREHYRRVVEQAEQDPDPDQLLTVRGQALAHLGDFEAAVAAAQEALRLSPENPQVIYEAALVYALAGDSASALWNARRAHELGVEARWFEFPWFDDIRPRM